MSPARSTRKPDVGARMDERDRVSTRLIRRLAEQGRWDIVDAVYGEAAPTLLCGSAPRLKAVTE